jgi:hypothetical protein
MDLQTAAIEPVTYDGENISAWRSKQKEIDENKNGGPFEWKWPIVHDSR